ERHKIRERASLWTEELRRHGVEARFGGSGEGAGFGGGGTYTFNAGKSNRLHFVGLETFKDYQEVGIQWVSATPAGSLIAESSYLPGVGPITALAYVLTMGDVGRFPRGKQVASYLGLIPREHSSGGRQKLGAITKQGNRMLRMLLVEAAQIAVRYDPEFRREYLHRCH